MVNEAGHVTPELMPPNMARQVSFYKLDSFTGFNGSFHSHALDSVPLTNQVQVGHNCFLLACDIHVRQFACTLADALADGNSGGITFSIGMEKLVLLF